MAKVDARWKEILTWQGDSGTLLFELTMGTLHIYFPTESTWANRAPAWAKTLYQEVYQDIKRWAAEKHIPITVQETAWMDSE